MILDGIGDRACRALEGKTPLEAAKTPNLDWFASKGKVDYCYPVREGYVPESDAGVVSLLGYDIGNVYRGSLEALGLGIKLRNGDLAFRCNFATVDGLGKEEGNVLDRRAGRTLTTHEARVLARAINSEVKLPFKFEFYPSVQHRGVLVIRGGFSNNISNVDAKDGKIVFSNALDDEEEGGKLSTELVNNFVRQSYEVLNKHPINLRRARKGLFAANVLLCRGAGNEVPRFKKLKGKWMSSADMPLEIGIARAVGMEIYRSKHPKFRGIDVYANLYAALKKNIKYSVRMLRRYSKKYDYFYVHFKATDLPGHDNKPLDKTRMIEMIDERFFGFLRKFIGERRLVVTGDHSTPCSLKAHSDEPVPVLSFNCANVKAGERRFTEREGLKGRRWVGRKLLEGTLFKK